MMFRSSFIGLSAIVCALACALAGCGGDSGSSSVAISGPSSSASSSSSSSSSSSASSSSASSSSGGVINNPLAQKAGYDLVFDENFDTLSVSAWGPQTTWIAHTPWFGDFGQATFADPVAGFPFTVQNGILRIEARKTGSTWQSGLLASVDANGNGFSQTYGYFEMRVKLPQGEGVWPSFWLDSLIPAGLSDPSLEVDVFEYYGKYDDAYNATVTLWPKDRTLATSHFLTVPVAKGSLASDYHLYGASVEADWTIIYLDGQEVWRTPTPAAHTHKLMILLDLALGGADQSLTSLVSPAYMYVDYVRAYRRTGTSA